MAARSSSKHVVYAALIGNLLVAITKFLAAYLTGSAAMLSEAVHSLVDTSNQGLLLYGLHRSARRPDERHPLGYGRELYFWSFIVALLMFTIGAGVTFYEGLHHIQEPSEITRPEISYVVLGLSAVFEGATWWVALRAFRETKGDLSYFEALRRSKDPPGFIVLFEDTAAIIGIAIALIGTAAAQWFEQPMLDGVAALGISLVLATTALMLARESKDLLIGEPAAGAVRQSIVDIARSVPGIERANLIFTVHLAPEQIVAALSLEFSDSLDATAIEETTIALERAIHGRHPEVVAVFVQPQAAGTFHSRRRRLLGLDRTALSASHAGPASN